jgi:hypothetical protein
MTEEGVQELQEFRSCRMEERARAAFYSELLNSCNS